MNATKSPLLSASQLARLAELGAERSAHVGEVLYRVGDQAYPFIALVEGEVAIVDAAGREIVRHGASRFLGELNPALGPDGLCHGGRHAALAIHRGRPRCDACDENGFILTGVAAQAMRLLETSVPGIFAAGDARSGSTKRCATAVGEGAMAVQLIHAHLAQAVAHPTG